MRTGAFDPKDAKIVADCSLRPAEEVKTLAQERYSAVLKVVGEEVLVSGSDDFTMFLWKPSSEKLPISRMTGHQQLVNDVKFSPDARLVASASFDKSIRVWCGKTGRFLMTLRGHVQVCPTVFVPFPPSCPGRLPAGVGRGQQTPRVRQCRLHHEAVEHGD